MFRLLFLFIKEKRQLLTYVAVAVGFTWICVTCQNRGDLVVKLNQEVGRLTDLLILKDDTIAYQRAKIGRLQRDTARLNSQLKSTQIVVLQKDAQLAAGELEAARTDERVEEGKKKVNGLVDKLNAQGKYIKAVNGLMANNLSTAGLKVEDTTNTGRIAKLTEYGKVYHDSTQALKRVNGQQKEEIKQLKTDNSNLKDEVSELERISNNIRADVQEDFIESQKEKHPLGFGQKASKERLRKKVLSRLPYKTN